MARITLSCTDNFKTYVKESSDSKGISVSKLIIELCTNGRITDASKRQKNQIEILYNLNVIRNEIYKISDHICGDDMVDIIALESLLVLENFIKEIINGK